jgi:hypothetical protein
LLKALAQGYFLHTAKRHTNRPVFYHYLTGTGSSLGTNEPDNANLLALHLVAESVLDIPTDEPRRHVSDTEWVIYHQVTYTIKAVMRVVSRIERGWVEDGLNRVRQVDTARLFQQRKPVEVVTVEVVEPVRMEVEDLEDKKRKRYEVIEAAKLRYMQRKR